MRRCSIFFGILLAAVALFPGCGQVPKSKGEPRPDIEADIEEQKDMVKEFDAALNSRDLERLLDLYSDVAVRLPPDADPLEGKESIGNALQQWFDDTETATHTMVVVDAQVSGDLAFARGTWESTETPKRGDGPKRLDGAWISVRRRQPDGSWKTIIEIWNRKNVGDD